MIYQAKNIKLTRVRRFTLIEVLAAMAVFMILVTVMMQFFTSARTLWLTSNRRTDLYANARIALDMMARDLQCTLYNNDNTTQGIYPFWFREYDQSGAGDMVEQLNFISSTDLRTFYAVSNICEVSYTYVKNEGTDVKDDTGADIPAGWLVRSCNSDKIFSGVSVIDNPRYTFMAEPFLTASSSRMTDIWNDANDRYKKVIPGVVSLNFTCYKDISNDPLTLGGAEFDPLDDADLGDAVGVYTKGRYGTDVPKVVKINIVLMDPDSWAKYNKIVGDDPLAAKQLKRSAGRSFSRTVYLTSLNSL